MSYIVNLYIEVENEVEYEGLREAIKDWSVYDATDSNFYCSNAEFPTLEDIEIDIEKK